MPEKQFYRKIFLDIINSTPSMVFPYFSDETGKATEKIKSSYLNHQTKVRIKRPRSDFSKSNVTNGGRNESKISTH